MGADVVHRIWRMGAGAAQGTWTRMRDAKVVHGIWLMGAGAAQGTWTRTRSADAVHETGISTMRVVVRVRMRFDHR